MTELLTAPLTVDNEDEAAFREMVRDFTSAEVQPRALEMDKASKIDPELIQKAFDLGLMGIEIPEEYGGAGCSFFTAIIAIEELAVADPSISVFVDVQNTLVNNALVRWMNPALKEKYLPRMASEWVGAYALSEPSSGSDAFALKTRAEDCGDHWKLNGSKMWITNGGEANLFIVFANTNFDLGYKGITAFLVERDFDGFTVGKKEDKLGIRASSTTELIFEDCIVPKDNVLGEVGKGYKVAIETLNEGRIGIGAQMIGLARGAFQNAMQYMFERKQFGQAIGSFQGMQFQYAQLAAEIESARLLVYNAARLKDAGKPFLKEAAMAKLLSSQIAEKTASLCVEFHGGVGFTTEFPAEKFYRDAKIGTIYEGTSNLQRQTIAKLLMKEYA